MGKESKRSSRGRGRPSRGRGSRGRGARGGASRGRGRGKNALQAKQLAKKRSKKNSKISRKVRNTKQRKKQRLKSKEKGKQITSQEENVDLEEAAEFFGQNSSVAKSFAGADFKKKQTKKRKRAAKAIEENKKKRRKLEEQPNSEDELSDLETYERGVRKPKSWNAASKSKRLPIKTSSGELKVAPEKEFDEEDNVDTSDEEREVKKVDPQKRRADIRVQIATLSQQLIANSEQKLARLGNLVRFCQDKDKVVQQWAMLSLTEVFRSILPGYRINTKLLKQPTDKLSKQVKQVRKFESTLIKHWSKFVFFLLKKVNILRNRKNPKDKVCLVAFSCVCKLFIYAHHFNLSKQIMKTMVEFLNHKNAELRKSWTKTFREVLSTNNMNTVMLEAIREVIKAIRKRDYKVEPDMVSILISLPLRNMEKPRRKKILVKGKKQKDKEKQLKLDLEEGNAFANREKVYKIHTEVLEMVFEVAFTILRMGGIKDPLLPIALKLLTKYSRLANLEIVLDMITSLGSLAAELPFESFLRATLCTFVMLQGRGRALEIDLQNFYSTMYVRMWEIIVNLEHGQLFVEALKIMLQVKTISKLRVAAFLKRSLSICMQVHSSLSQQLLELAFFLFSRHFSSLMPMLETEGEGGEIFNPEEKIPDVSNSKNAKLWELPMLQTSYHLVPAISAAQMVEASGPIQPMKIEAKKVFKPSLLKKKPKQTDSLQKVKAKATSQGNINFKKDFKRFENEIAENLYSLVVVALSRTE